MTRVLFLFTTWIMDIQEIEMVPPEENYPDYLLKLALLAQIQN